MRELTIAEGQRMLLLDKTCQRTYRLGCDANDLSRVMDEVRGWLDEQLVDPMRQLQLLLCLREAVHNAIEHGCLELDTSLRDTPGWSLMIQQRRESLPWQSRQVAIHCAIDRSHVTLVVRDDGNGYATSQVPDPRAQQQLDKCGGRGLLMIRSVMDCVSFNSQGNEITMVRSIRS